MRQQEFLWTAVELRRASARQLPTKKQYEMQYWPKGLRSSVPCSSKSFPRRRDFGQCCPFGLAWDPWRIRNSSAHQLDFDYVVVRKATRTF